MAASKKHRSKPKLLSHTRPPVHSLSTTISGPKLSSRATRTLIRTHHTLHKQLSYAIAANDTDLASSLRAQIDAHGGLEKYQRASIQGQAGERGGDSSKVLMEWIEEARRHNSKGSPRAVDDGTKKLRMLEVGSLRVDNACARSGLFEMDRIDLHSQHKDIVEQDFMQRPIPDSTELDEVGFDVVSLSLVVNYVGDAIQRGEMLKRVERFLRRQEASSSSQQWQTKFSPGVFLVLPAPCVSNSRYLDEDRLEAIMVALGYEMVKKKLSSKLVYCYLRFAGRESSVNLRFEKAELRTGRNRNNFAIIVR